MRHVMIDIETLSRQPNASILTIGAVAIEDGEIVGEFDMAIDPRLSGPKYHIDPDTVVWWMRQPDEARAAATGGGQSIAVVMGDLKRWLPSGDNAWESPPRFKIWANSPRFDIAILEHAFAVQGLGFPWDHRDVLDLRTLVHLRDPEGLLKPPDDDAHHTAIGDARWQARYLLRLFEEEKMISGWLETA